MLVLYDGVMEYQIGNENLRLKVQADGHADLMRDNSVRVCLSESEAKALLRFILDAETKKEARREKDKTA